MSTTITTLTDPAHFPWLCGQIKSQHWGRWLSDEQIIRGAKNSVCFWLIDTAHAEPIGFARVVTDHATFSSVCDVFVIESLRGRGYGSQLMRAVVEHPAVARTVSILQTRDMDSFYNAFGYRRDRPAMKRDPDV